jgi:hypothetical protein
MKGDDPLILTAVLSMEEDMYIAECPEVGTVSQGRTWKRGGEQTSRRATALNLAEFPMEECGAAHHHDI